MNKAQKRFRRTAVLVVFVLLTALLSVINIINFTMVAEDADHITQMIADHGGSFGKNSERPDNFRPQSAGKPNMRGWTGPMGPDSPETGMSIRYFTFAFDKDGKTAESIAFNMSAVTLEEAAEWAQMLLQKNIGWTNQTYRFRVYEGNYGRTFVTVIDQGRELLPSYRILIISVIGGLLFVVLSWLILRIVWKRIFSTIAEADRKQKKFIANANREFRQPLTILSAETELIERTGGPTKETRSIRRQIGKLDQLVEKLGTIGIFDKENAKPANVSFSEYLEAALDAAAGRFTAAGKTLRGSVAPGITLSANPEAISKVLAELTENALNYSLTWATFRLYREGDRIVLESANDAALPDGPTDQVFDRFTTLANAGVGINNTHGMPVTENTFAGRTDASRNEHIKYHHEMTGSAETFAEPSEASLGGLIKDSDDLPVSGQASVGSVEVSQRGHSGLGLAYVKEVVNSLNGRVSARVSDGVFTLRIAL